jgi:hypothetical protein
MENFNKIVNQLISESKKDANDISSIIEKRKKGADKIRKQAEAAGGPSKLTAIHFAAKAKPYAQALSMTSKKGFEKSLKEKGDRIAARLQQWHNLSQRDFQDLMGQLEAYGEMYILSVKPNSVKLD